jgi:hypothetical protein
VEQDWKYRFPEGGYTYIGKSRVPSSTVQKGNHGFLVSLHIFSETTLQFRGWEQKNEG